MLVACLNVFKDFEIGAAWMHDLTSGLCFVCYVTCLGSNVFIYWSPPAYHISCRQSRCFSINKSAMAHPGPIPKINWLMYPEIENGFKSIQSQGFGKTKSLLLQGVGEVWKGVYLIHWRSAGLKLALKDIFSKFKNAESPSRESHRLNTLFFS